MNAASFTPFIILRAVDQTRGESVNAGVILFSSFGPRVGVASDTARIRAVHPDYAALSLRDWGARLENSLRVRAEKMADLASLVAMLPLLCHPFIPDVQTGTASVDPDRPDEALESLLNWQVHARPVTVRPHRDVLRRQTKLAVQMRAWFRKARVFSTNHEDLSRGRVVANFPVAARDDLYADFAVKNGRLHVLETLDLRGVDHLTAAVRGDAAVKGITLDEARQAVDGSRIAVVSASNFEIGRPAIKLLERYASDLYVMESPADKQKFVDFMHHALHNAELPDLVLSSA